MPRLTLTDVMATGHHLLSQPKLVWQDRGSGRGGALLVRRHRCKTLVQNRSFFWISWPTELTSRRNSVRRMFMAAEKKAVARVPRSPKRYRWPTKCSSYWGEITGTGSANE